MKKIIFLFLLVSVLLISAVVSASDVGGHDTYFTIMQGYSSRYIWRGLDIFSPNGGAHQQSIDMAITNILSGVDLSFNIWACLPVSKGHENSKEIDYAINLSKSLFEGRLNAVLGLVYYDYPNLSRGADIFEPGLTLILEKIPFLPMDISFITFAGYSFQVVSNGPDEGWFFSWGFSTDMPLLESAIFQEGQSLNISITNWGNDGALDLKPSLLYATEVSVSTSYMFKGFSISPSFNYVFNYKDEINGGNNEIWGGLEVSYTF